MATAAQLKSLIQSHLEDNSEKFNTVALQIAAHEARLGHATLANEIRKIIDKSKFSKPKFKSLNSDLQGLVLEMFPVDILADLIIDDSIKSRILRVINEYYQKDKLHRHNLENRRKLLLAGPPGTGKTMTSYIISNELHLPIYVILMDKVVTKYMGETSAKLRQIFDMIEEHPAVYLFDEFDAIGTHRNKDNDVGEMRRVLNSFLQFIDRDHSESIIIAATNNLELLDQALFRRFDDVIHYHLPSDDEKLCLLKNRLGTKISITDLKKVLPNLETLSHAEINQACLDAIKESILSNSNLDVELIEKCIIERKQAYHL